MKPSSPHADAPRSSSPNREPSLGPAAKSSLGMTERVNQVRHRFIGAAATTLSAGFLGTVPGLTRPMSLSTRVAAFQCAAAGRVGNRSTTSFIVVGFRRGAGGLWTLGPLAH
jgi:hypothetical protein